MDGLNLYASDPFVDRTALLSVCRYVMRPALSLARLKRRADGMLTYRLKPPDGRGNTVLVLHPLELMARLASLVPAPNRPTRRLIGILAPGAKDRAKVVPEPTHRKPSRAHPDAGHAPAVARGEIRSADAAPPEAETTTPTTDTAHTGAHQPHDGPAHHAAEPTHSRAHPALRAPPGDIPTHKPYARPIPGMNWSAKSGAWTRCAVRAASD